MSHSPPPAAAGGFAPLSPPAAAVHGNPGVMAATAQPEGRVLVDPQTYVNEYTRPLPDPDVVFSGPGYYSPPTPTCGFSTAALLLSLIGVVLAVPAVVAIALGHIGLYRTRDFRRNGRAMALGGTILGYAVVLFWAVLISSVWISDL